MKEGRPGYDGDLARLKWKKAYRVCWKVGLHQQAVSANEMFDRASHVWNRSTFAAWCFDFIGQCDVTNLTQHERALVY